MPWLDLDPLDDGSALTSASREPLCEVVSGTQGLGIDVKQGCIELNAVNRASVAAANRGDELASSVRVAASALSASPLDAVIRGGAVAHHALQLSPSEESFNVIVVPGRCVDEAVRSDDRLQ